MNIKKILYLFAPACLLTFSALSYADNQQGFFIGAGGSSMDIDDLDLWTAEAFVGYKLNPWVGAEFHYGEGLGGQDFSDKAGIIDNATTNNSSDNRNIDIDNYQTLYYRAEAVNNKARFYMLLGYANVAFDIIDTQANGQSAWIHKRKHDFSWGLGAGLIVYPRVSFNLEYKSLIDIHAGRISSLAGTVDYRF